MVHEPIKLLGMKRFAGPALKGLMAQVEDQLRSLVRAFAAGEIEASAARQSVQEALDEYRSGLAELLDAR
jgi:hypothetical protein